MTLFTTRFLAGLRESHDPTRWPGLLAERPDLRGRVEAAVAAIPEAVRDEVASRLTSTSVRDLFLGRAVLWGLTLAGLGGAQPVGWVDEDLVRMRGPAGDWLLAPLIFHTGGTGPGRPELVDKLLRALESTFEGRPWALHVRRPLSPDFDLDAVTKAVQLWVRAVERGEWRGRHAIYDDDRISIELTLLESSRRREGDALTFLVGPSAALERLALVDSHLQQLARQLGEEEARVVPLLVAQPRWQVTRGYMCQLLYGTPDEVRASSEGEVLATYRSERFSLLADPQFQRLAAIWWVEAAPSDPLGFSGWAHENPWCPAREVAPIFPGTRYRVVDPEAGTMTWEGKHPTRWEERVEP